MVGTEPRKSPSRDEVLAGTSEIVAGVFSLLRAHGSTAPKTQRNARVLIAVASMAGGAGQLRGIDRLQIVKATGYVVAFAVVIADKRRRRNE